LVPEITPKRGVAVISGHLANVPPHGSAAGRPASVSAHRSPRRCRNRHIARSTRLIEAGIPNAGPRRANANACHTAVAHRPGLVDPRIDHPNAGRTDAYPGNTPIAHCAGLVDTRVALRVSWSRHKKAKCQSRKHEGGVGVDC
jgi:hypothetical protein